VTALRVDDDEHDLALAGGLPVQERPARALTGTSGHAVEDDLEVQRVARADLAAEAGRVEAAEER
jgi:hypothetical protein